MPENWFVFSLFGVSLLPHTNGLLSVVEPIQGFLLYFPPIVDGLGLQVGILVKSNTFQRLDELFYHQIVICASIVVCLNEMSNMLFWITLSIKLLELYRLVAMGYAECATL